MEKCWTKEQEEQVGQRRLQTGVCARQVMDHDYKIHPHMAPQYYHLDQLGYSI